MTLDQKYLISPADIIGIQYECRHCHATYSIPLKSWDRTIHECPNCKEMLIQGTLTPEKPREDEGILRNFANILALMQNHKFAAIIKIEIVHESQTPV